MLYQRETETQKWRTRGTPTGELESLAPAAFPCPQFKDMQSRKTGNRKTKTGKGKCLCETLKKGDKRGV